MQKTRREVKVNPVRSDTKAPGVTKEVPILPAQYTYRQEGIDEVIGPGMRLACHDIFAGGGGWRLHPYRALGGACLFLTWPLCGKRHINYSTNQGRGQLRIRNVN